MPNLTDQLEQMPKPPVQDVVTSVSAQAKTILLASLAFPIVSLALYGISNLAANRNAWEIGAAVAIALWPGPLLVGIIMCLWERVQNGKLQRLTKGNYYVHWHYAEPQWSQHCEQSMQLTRRGVPIFVGILVVMGILFAAMVHFDDDKLFFGSVVTHYGICIAIMAVAGAIIGQLCMYLANMTYKLKRTKTAQALIGPEGIYITGQFSPLETFGHRFITAGILTTSPDQIRFLFETKTKHGWTETPVLIPIPPDQAEVVQVLLKLVNRVNSTKSN